MSTHPCPHCGIPLEDNPGAFYHKAACEARALRAQLRATTDAAEQARLRAEIERAKYVGD